jgi:hypothetical protein
VITFFPRHIGPWNTIFDFEPDITLTPKARPNARTGMGFHNREEFIQFLKDSGIRLDNPEFPLKIEQANERVYLKGHAAQGELLIVVQWTVIGWIRDNYRGS